MKRHIPNFITLLNLLSGCLGVIFVFEGNLVFAAYAIWVSALFDFFDGFAARLLKVSSPIGKELDSLADMVTFGVLPAFMMMSIVVDAPNQYLKFIPLVIALFAALRLAKFNTDDSQTTSFIGMPTPSVAFFVSGLPFWLTTHNELFSWPIVIILSLTLALVMVMPMRMLALKFKDYKISSNWSRYGLVLVGVTLFILLGPKSLSITIAFYLLLSIIMAKREAIS